MTHSPVDEPELVDGVDGEGGLGDVELCALLAQRVLLHQQRHHVACKQGRSNLSVLLESCQ